MEQHRRHAQTVSGVSFNGVIVANGRFCSWSSSTRTPRFYDNGSHIPDDGFGLERRVIDELGRIAVFKMGFFQWMHPDCPMHTAFRKAMSSKAQRFPYQSTFVNFTGHWNSNAVETWILRRSSCTNHRLPECGELLTMIDDIQATCEIKAQQSFPLRASMIAIVFKYYS